MEEPYGRAYLSVFRCVARGKEGWGQKENVSGDSAWIPHVMNEHVLALFCLKLPNSNESEMVKPE
jgi:hypothetical protein